MKFDSNSWNNKVKLRVSLANYAKMVMSLTAINFFYALTDLNWFIMILNFLMFFPALFTILSKVKYDKGVPDGE